MAITLTHFQARKLRKARASHVAGDTERTVDLLLDLLTDLCDDPDDFDDSPPSSR